MRAYLHVSLREDPVEVRRLVTGARGHVPFTLNYAFHQAEPEECLVMEEGRDYYLLVGDLGVLHGDGELVQFLNSINPETAFVNARWSHRNGLEVMVDELPIIEGDEVYVDGRPYRFSLQKPEIIIVDGVSYDKTYPDPANPHHTD